MKKCRNLIIVAGLGISAVSAQAELSASVGFASEYYFRGELIKESSASASLDVEQNGLYAGTWIGDVGDGLEYDLYAGYNTVLQNGLSLGAGVAGYFFTSDTFEDTFQEVSLSMGYGMVSAGYTSGTHDLLTGGDEHYDFKEITVAKNGLYGTYGSFGNDKDGDYIELGYGMDVNGFDLTIALIISDKDLSQKMDANGNPVQDEAIVFTIGKTFSL